MNSIKKILAITLVVIMSLGIVSASAFAEGETEVTPEEITNEIISVVDITVAAPVEGEYAIGDYEYEGADYTVEFLEWVGFETGVIYYSTDEEAEIANEPFTAGSAYVVCITVSAAEGFAFDAQENLIVSINGYEAQIFDLTEDGKELSFSCLFECEAEEEIGDDNGSVDGSFSFTMVLDFIKSVFRTFFRLIGSLIGL